MVAGRRSSSREEWFCVFVEVLVWVFLFPEVGGRYKSVYMMYEQGESRTHADQLDLDSHCLPRPWQKFYNKLTNRTTGFCVVFLFLFLNVQ